MSDDDEIMQGFGQYGSLLVTIVGKKRQRSKDDELYGVFNTEEQPLESSSYLEKGGLSFVKSSTIQAATATTSSSSDGISESDSESSSSSEDEVLNKDSIGQDKIWSEMSRMEFGKQKELAAKPVTKPVAKPIQKVDRNFGQFEKHTKGIGLKLMMKMGYKPGQGLGADKEGMVNPIDVKLRPKQMGLGHGGFDEKTKAVKRDIEPVESNWKKSAPKKQPLKQKTVQELVQEPPKPVKIIDMTGTEAKEITDLTGISSKATFDSTEHLPELRHNISLLLDMYQAQIHELVRKLRAEKSILSGIDAEKNSFESHVTIMKEKQSSLSQVLAITKKLSACVDCEEIIDLVVPFYSDNSNLWWNYRMDYALVAALVPFFRRSMSEWTILSEPLIFKNELFKLKKSLIPLKLEKVACPFECMMQKYWLPKVRSFITNEWDPINSSEFFIEFLNEWFTSKLADWDPETEPLPCDALIPYWMHLNILEQLIIPRLNSTVELWKGPNLSLWLFPWFPILPSQAVQHLLVLSRQSLTAELKSWHPSDDSAIQMLKPWALCLSQSDFEKIVRAAIIPKLLVSMTDFEVNPLNQSLEKLEWCFKWSSLVSCQVLSTVFCQQFFPKWHLVLEKWLQSPKADYSQISEWYSSWKKVFEPVLCDEIQLEFRRGLDLMSAAISGESVAVATTTAPTLKYHKLSFKELVENEAAEYDLLLTQVNQVHVQGYNRHVLYRLAKHGSAGILVYIDENVLFVQQGSEFVPVSVQEAIEMAA